MFINLQHLNKIPYIPDISKITNAFFNIFSVPLFSVKLKSAYMYEEFQQQHSLCIVLYLKYLKIFFELLLTFFIF